MCLGFPASQHVSMIDPGSVQNACRRRVRKTVAFGPLFGRLWGPSWAPKGSPRGPQGRPKRGSKRAPRDVFVSRRLGDSPWTSRDPSTWTIRGSIKPRSPGSPGQRWNFPSRTYNLRPDRKISAPDSELSVLRSSIDNIRSRLGIIRSPFQHR